MTDQEAVQLLKLLDDYCTDCPDENPAIMTVSDLAEDLAMSLPTLPDELTGSRLFRRH